MSKEELQAKLVKANAENKGMVVYPEYFKKKKKRMRPDFIKKLEETAKADFTDVDDYGVYKVGSFLYKMAQIFGDRAEANEIKGVILYQIPNGEMEAE